jgi:ferredoxin
LSFENKELNFNWDKCMGCGVCNSQCPKDAMTLVRDEGKGLPMDVREILTRSQDKAPMKV